MYQARPFYHTGGGNLGYIRAFDPHRMLLTVSTGDTLILFPHTVDMRSLVSLLAAAAVFSGNVFAAPSPKYDRRSLVERDGVTLNVFEHAATGAKLEFVKNSGICETTPGVNQYSGYISVGDNMNMWFW